MLVELAAASGRIWAAKPAIDHEGAICTFQLQQEAARVSCLAFSAASLLLGVNNGSTVALHLRQNRYSSTAGCAPCACIAASPVRDEHAVGAADGTVSLFSGSSAPVVLGVHRSSVHALAYNVSGTRLVSVSSDSVVVWDVQVSGREGRAPSVCCGQR